MPLDLEGYDGQPVDIIIDFSRLKVSNRGEWMRQKWHAGGSFLMSGLMRASDGDMMRDASAQAMILDGL